MQNIKKQYDAKFDIAKFILSFFVVAIHSGLFPYALYPWLRIAVPMFFMITSYFLFSALDRAEPEKKSRIVKKFVLRNIKLYLCWFVVLLPFTLIIYKDDYLTGLSGVKEFIKDFVWGGTFVASWYITASVIGVLIVYYLCKWLKGNLITFAVSLLAFVLVTLESSYSVWIDNTFVGGITDGFGRIFVGIVYSFPASLVWIVMGKLFAEGKIKLLSYKLLVPLTLVFGAGLYAEWWYVRGLDGSLNNDSYFLLLPLCVALFAILLKIPPVYNKNSVYLKHASTVIYVIHGSALGIFDMLARKLIGGVHPVVSFLVACVLSLGVLVLLEIANKKFADKKLGNLLRCFY